MVQKEHRDAAGLLQITFLPRQTEHAGVAVESPRLSAAPCRIVGEALMGLPDMGFARNRVVGDHVPRTEIGAVMIFHRLVGVRNRHLPERLVARITGRPQQEFEVHHVVDDDRVLPLVAVVVPRADQPHFRLETRRQRPGSGEQHLFVGLVPGEAQSVAETAIQHESHVVVVGRIFFAFDARGVHPGVFQNPRIAAVFIHVPQRSRKIPGHHQRESDETSSPFSHVRGRRPSRPLYFSAISSTCRSARASASSTTSASGFSRPPQPANSADSPIHSNIFFIVLYF